MDSSDIPVAPSTPEAAMNTVLPTPMTPIQRVVRQNPACDQPSTIDDLPDWMHYDEHQIQELDRPRAQELLREAIQLIKSLEATLNRIKISEAHHKFNHRMLMAEQKERSQRQAVEQHLHEVQQSLLLEKLSHSDEELFRQRHKKAKRRLKELEADNRRQEHSLSHLQRQLHDIQHAKFAPHLRGNDGGLDVLSDAATQMREMDNSSNESLSIQRTLMSPVAFEPSPGIPQTPQTSSSKRRISDDTVIEDNSFSDNEYKVPRRLDYSSTTQRQTKRPDPLTPKSP